MDKLISIVVPVYNTSKYLKECVLSILKQDYENFELILVDDGSKDNSLELCKELAKEDKRIKVVHQENGGVSKARNTGIENASGDYLTFIDSDDLVDPNYLSTLVSHKTDDVSLVALGYKRLNVDGSIYPVYKFIPSKKYEFDEIKNNIIDDGTITGSPLNTCWASLFELKEVKGKLCFNSELKYAEDGLFTAAYFLRCHKGAYIDFECRPYTYRDAENSLVSTRNFLSEASINENKKYIEELRKASTGLIDEKDLETQIKRREITLFWLDSMYIVSSKEGSYKLYKEALKVHDVINNLNCLDYTRMKKVKKIFVKLLKLHMYRLSYMLFKMKFGK